ncbi:MAG: ABC transporter ATP-binding protein [Ignavibacteriales bacterium]|nr:ABC transporter ATP-binding protein [Ignavibacteriales bacterium]
MLEIKNISKHFRSKLVVDNVSFDVKINRIFGLIGPNGAGKTTTIRMILNILIPEKGEILFNGKKLDQDFLNITGYLPEERGLYPKSSVANILTYLANLKGVSNFDAKKIISYWLERLNLLEVKNAHLEELSKGNQQKIQFIAAIQHNPKILILDEPFSGFDPLNQSIFTEIINEIKNDKFIILSTHQMDLAEKLCNDFILINKGKEVLKGDLNSVLNSSNQNVYEITYNSLNFESINSLTNIEILESYYNKVKILIKNNDDDNFLKTIVNENSIVEFKKIIPSLHQLFISNVGGN